MSDNTFDNTFNNSNATLRPIYMSVPKSYVLSGKIMVGVIVFLIVFVVLMIGLHKYARWYMLRVRRRRRRHRHRHRTHRQRASNIMFYVDHSSTAIRTGNCGLEISVRNSLPLFVYSEVTHKDDLECAVCLSELEEGETGRILPKCYHSFHIECIDMWFHSHSTCPICRAKVEPVDPTRNKDVLVMVGKPVQEVELAHVQPSNSSSREMSLDERRNGLDLAGVKIEVPSMAELVDEPRPSSPSSYEFMSPGNRLQSLKKMVSINNKSSVASSSTEIGTSCSSDTELDIELRICKDAGEQVQTLPPK